MRLADVVAVHRIDVHLVGHLGRQEVHACRHGCCCCCCRGPSGAGACGGTRSGGGQGAPAAGGQGASPMPRVARGRSGCDLRHPRARPAPRKRCPSKNPPGSAPRGGRGPSPPADHAHRPVALPPAPGLGLCCAAEGASGTVGGAAERLPVRQRRRSRYAHSRAQPAGRSAREGKASGATLHGAALGLCAPLSALASPGDRTLEAIPARSGPGCSPTPQRKFERWRFRALGTSRRPTHAPGGTPARP